MRAPEKSWLLPSSS